MRESSRTQMLVAIPLFQCQRCGHDGARTLPSSSARGRSEEGRYAVRRRRELRWDQSDSLRGLPLQERKDGRTVSHDICVLQSLERLRQHISWMQGSGGRGQSVVDLCDACYRLDNAYDPSWPGMLQAQYSLRKGAELDDPEILQHLESAVNAGDTVKNAHDLARSLSVLSRKTSTVKP